MFKHKNYMIIAFDSLITVVSLLLSVVLLSSSMISVEDLLIIIGVHFVFRLVFRVGMTILRKMSLSETINILLSNLVSFGTLILFLGFKNFDISLLFLIFVISSLAQIVSRICYVEVYALLTRKKQSETRKNVAVYGAGKAGEMVAQEIIANGSLALQMTGFFDDNKGVKRNTLLGYSIFGGREMLNEMVETYDIDVIYLAMPSVSKYEQNKILEACYKTGVSVKSIPSFESFLDNKNLKRESKTVEIVDLLNRNEIKLDNERVEKIIKNEVVLVTGAGGSIGSELVRQIVRQKPKALILMDIAENGVYAIQQEILMAMRLGTLEEIEINAYICSMTDKPAVQSIFDKHQIDIVFHAAAHKHVPLMETSPLEAIKNNVFGTRNLIELSSLNTVKTFLNISTDKAVNPTNIMGATKRIIEMLLLRETGRSQTKFVAVRFGNVLGSNGSVIPLFERQIEAGGPVTVTHPDIVRYFMTIPEAVSLVLEAASYADGGEIFVLDMGEPVKILDMAEKMIELSGYKPYDEIPIVFSGLRNGEKLYEELLLNEEGLRKTPNDLIYIISQIAVDSEEIDQGLRTLEELINKNADKATVIKTLNEFVPSFNHIEN